VVVRHDIEEVVTKLREIERTTGLERAVAIGKIVLERFFGGSAEAWRARRRNKNNSVRKLADHPDCPLSRSALGQAIGTYVVVQQLPCVSTFGHITASHVAALLHLPLDAQREWLETAEQRGWSVRQLQERVTTQRRVSGERRGRPRAPAARKAMSSVRSALRALERAVGRLSELELRQSERGELENVGARLAAVGARLPPLARLEQLP
jgi:hypothetical protein